jgi:hypothetical protein
MSADWTSPEALRGQVERLWQSGRLLTDETLFPLELKLKRPGSRALSERFDEVRMWIRELESEPAFQIEWAEVDHRVLGRNQVPVRVFVANRNDALRLIGRVAEAERIQSLAAATALRLPELNDWFARKPLVALENTTDWDRILDVLVWFRANPRCGLYLRQLDIAGADSKFIETRKPLLAELLDALLIQVECPRGPRWFEQRYGLATKPLQIRFRVLDRRLAVSGLTDLAVTVNEMATLDLRAGRVFITENEVNGLAFPAVPDSIVIFGLGYGVEILSGISWLAERELRYWGDIDTYGFHILDRLRATFPHAQSFLMDRSTLLAHEALWVREENAYKGELLRLTESERAVYEGLQGVRLEQERIRYGWLLDALTPG